MSEAIIGIQKCGCITYANARPDELDKADQRAIAKIIGSGGEVVRTTVAGARRRKHFLPAECPHDPKGWKYEPPPDPEARIHTKRVASRDLSVVYQGRAKRLGEVGKRDAGWLATEGWLQRDGTASDGTSERGPAEVLGPFPTRKEAIESLSESSVREAVGQ